MAAAFQLPLPEGGTWLQQFEHIAELLPHAIVLVDMAIPGVKVGYCNAASEKMLGYTKAEHVGQNCRFLQGKKTEAAAVRAMVKSIRAATATTVRVTNYKKGGKAFTNVLTLHPVKDSSGAYRYSIGLQSDSVSAERFAPPSLPERFAPQPSSPQLRHRHLKLHF